MDEWTRHEVTRLRPIRTRARVQLGPYSYTARALDARMADLRSHGRRIPAIELWQLARAFERLSSGLVLFAKVFPELEVTI